MSGELLSVLAIGVLLLTAVSIIVVVALARGEFKRVPLPDAPSELTGLFLEELEKQRKKKVMRRLSKHWLRGG